MKRILFLSALDFKKRSIQVIRLTPEAYAAAGWDVIAVVCRDQSTSGDYSYEQLETPVGVQVERLRIPRWPQSSRVPTMLRPLAHRLVVAWNVIRLAWYGYVLARRRPFQIIYGYEVQGALAAGLVAWALGMPTKKVVTRFQGSHLYEAIEHRRWLWLMGKLDHLLAMRVPAGLTIMTDDGTRGDRLLNWLRVTPKRDVRFWVNGVDLPKRLSPEDLSPQGLTLFCVSRLVGWKRVDRALDVIAALRQQRPDWHLDHVVLGDGNEREALEAHALRMGLVGTTRFVGAVEHQGVLNAFATRSIFLSFYDGSNVGNPLLEAIRHNSYVFTLLNGDTARWIQHEQNGFAYHPASFDPSIVAADIVRLVESKELQQRIRRGVTESARQLWTWEERLAAEVHAVTELADSR